MKKIRKSLECPICHAFGNDKTYSYNDNYQKKETEKKTVVNIRRIYTCHCKKCNKNYQVDYGKAKLVKYKPFIYGVCLDDVKIYVTYESEFDRSYKIITVNNTPMILAEDDDFPIIINNQQKEELVNNHDKTKGLVFNTWMNRYR